MLHLLITGSRTWLDAEFIYVQIGRLYRLHQGLEIHHGMCPEGGADLLADQIGNDMAAQGLNVTVVRHPMDRERYGRAAGPIRNTIMVTRIAALMLAGESVACHAFHRNNSRGTSDCAYKALRAGIPTVTHVWNGDAEVRTVVEEEQLVLPAWAAA